MASAEPYVQRPSLSTIIPRRSVALRKSSRIAWATVTPRASITEPDAFGALLRAIDTFDGQPSTRAALQLMALLFLRPGELRAAEWSEFDFDKAIWTIPAGRMKMRRPHQTPLSRQATEVLRGLHMITGRGTLLFPGVRTPRRPISDNTLNAALRRLGYGKDEAAAHGCRATASSLLNECDKWHPDAIERQLAHVENNDVRRAYACGEHWQQRVDMMQWWADLLEKLRVQSGKATGRTKASDIILEPASVSDRETMLFDHMLG
ncbi:MAG: site-specific integrase [Magnetospirillum sp.]|nr:site-specific integrase [Magnetospirillum sp.]